MSDQYSDGYQAAARRFEGAITSVIDRVAEASREQVRETLDELREATLGLLRASRLQSEDDLTMLFDDLVVRYGLRAGRGPVPDAFVAPTPATPPPGHDDPADYVV